MGLKISTKIHPEVEETATQKDLNGFSPAFVCAITRKTEKG